MKLKLTDMSYGFPGSHKPETEPEKPGPSETESGTPRPTKPKTEDVTPAIEPAVAKRRVEKYSDPSRWEEVTDPTTKARSQRAVYLDSRGMETRTPLLIYVCPDNSQQYKQYLL